MKVNFNVKGKSGSITVFVLTGMLFMSAFLILAFAANSNKSKISAEQFNIISKIYSHQDGDESAYERVFVDLRNGNKQTATKTVEQQSSLELTNTFYGSLNNYKIYGKGLPLEYQQVEYLESTGTQYIDTGVQAYSDTAVEFKITSMSEQVTQYPQLFGAQQYQNGENRFGIAASSFNARTGSISFGPSTITFDEPHVGRLEFNNYELDGIIYTASSTWVDPGINMYLFNVNDAILSGRMDTACVARFYYFKIYNGTTLVRDFIPCYRNSDNKPGLYDLVEGDFYENAGTGDFVVGENIYELPSEYQEVEYLESTGGQYIDTQYIMKDNSTFECIAAFMEENKFLNYGAIYKDGSTYYRAHFGSSENSKITLYNSGEEHINIEYDNDWHKYIFSPTVTSLDETNELTAALNYPQISMYLFKRNSNFQTEEIEATSRVKYTKIWENNILVRYMIPCYRKVDNVAGLYDLVNGVFYTNAGTGEFVVGNSIEEETDDNTVVYADMLGDLVEDSSDENYGKYKIAIKSTDEYENSVINNIYLSMPLASGEYIDSKTGKVIRIDGTEEVTLPKITTYDDYTKIEVLTQIVPTKIEVEYIIYTIESKS